MNKLYALFLGIELIAFFIMWVLLSQIIYDTFPKEKELFSQVFLLTGIGLIFATLKNETVKYKIMKKVDKHD